MVARSTLSRNFLCILVATMWYLGERKNGTFSRPMASHPTSIEFVLLGGKGVVGSKILTLICCHWLLTCWLSSTSYGVPRVRKYAVIWTWQHTSVVAVTMSRSCIAVCCVLSHRLLGAGPVDIIDQGWQLQPTGGPYNSLRTRLRAEHVYAHVEGWRLNWLERRYLQTIS